MQINAIKPARNTGFWTFGVGLNIVLFQPLSPDKNSSTMQTDCAHDLLVFIIVLDLTFHNPDQNKK